MTASLAVRLRRVWLDVHLWIGVGLLVVFIPLALSGAVLVWHDGLDRVIHPARYATGGPGPALPLATYGQAARAAFQGRADLTQIRLPEKLGDPVVAVGRVKGPAGPNGRPRSLNAWIDPATAKVLDTADSNAGVLRVMHQLHGSLFIPDVGRKVVGWLGWAMFASSATGLWLWWPRNGAVLKALRWRRGASKLFNLHHMVGFWVCLPLAILSLTGVYIAFPQTGRALFGVAPIEGAARPGGNRFAPPLAHPRLSMAQAGAAALAAASGARLASLTLPVEGKTPAWRIQLREPGVKEPVTVQVVDATGSLKPDRGAGPDPLSRWMRRVHDGDGMGLAWQGVIFAGGVAPALLALTGLVMWLRRRSRRAAVSRPARA